MPVDRIEAWLRMRDAARFRREADSAGRSVRGIGHSATSANAQMGLLERTSGSAMGLIRGVGTAALYTVGGLGLLAGAGAAVGTVLGIKFNANMEQLEVAFQNFLGTRKRTVAYLDDLYKIAATTPFEFPELAGAARRFLAFGFAAKETKRILLTVGDTVAGIGGGAEEIQRLTLSLGQIQAKGRLQSEELLQLAELGIPAYRILRKELGLTADQLGKRLKKGSIDADTAIDALTKGMDRAFGGSSRKQAKTFIGQLSTMKDNAMAALGALSKPAFDLLKRDVFPRLGKGIQTISDWARGGGGKRAVGAITAGFERGGQAPAGGVVEETMFKIGAAAKSAMPWVIKGFNIAKGVVMDFLDALAPAQPFLQNVIIPLFKGLAIGVLGSLVGAWKIALFVLKAFMIALGFLGKIMAPFRPVFYALGVVIGFVFGGPILKAIGIISKFAKILSWPIRMIDNLVGVVFGVIAVFRVFWPILRHGGKVVSFITGHFKFFWGIIRAGMKLWGRFGWLIGPFIISKLRGLINPVNTVKGAFQVLGVVFRFVSRMISAIVKGIGALIDKIGDLPEMLGSGKGGGLLGLGGIDKFKWWGTGGVISRGDVGIVGDTGPELVRGTAAGTHVTPLARGKGGGILDPVIHVHSHISMVVAGREIGKVTADQVADWRARKGQSA